MDTAPLQVENLGFRYRTAATPSLHDVDFAARAGELLVVVGGSGSGKSTLLRCLNGLIPRSYRGDLTGMITIGGQNPAELGLAELAQLVGTVLQDPDRQIVASYVGRQVAFGPENLGWPRERIHAAVSSTLERLGIAHLRHRETGLLSGGERQKVALAGLLSMEPRILLLDEPLASLDPASAREALALFRQLADEGHTVLLVEHRVEDVLHARPERALFLREGRQAFLGPTAEFLQLADPLEVKLPAAIALQSLASEHAMPSVVKPRLAPGNPIIAFDDIHFAYDKGTPILKGVSLDVREGEVVAILGPNGAGKTTLLRHAIGLLRPTRGQVRVNGVDARQATVAQLARTVGYVFQSPSHMLFAPTVREELLFGPRNIGRDVQAMEAAVPQALAQVGLADFEERAPLSLSFGQQKRLGIAAVLSMQPRVLVLDEPTAGQDHGSTRMLMQTIGRLEGLAATVLITHDVDLAVSYATRVVLMRDGQIEADGPPEQVLGDRALMERCRVVPTSLLELNLRLLPRTGRFLPLEQLVDYVGKDERRTTNDEQFGDFTSSSVLRPSSSDS
ncbi:MAG TPA: ATP-binding cassette domain-containing protein [Roseiflexaceae bacterium]|nr:ATP-binding cassette domain-containing protein [Roseiflexaceae bacterium]